MSQKIEELKIKDLIPYSGNTRTHDQKQIMQIASSIKEFGFTNPVLIDGANGVIAGHGRLLAAQKLSMETVPCLRLGHLTDAQRRAYVIADNKLALNAGWDEEALAVEIERLLEDGFDLDLTGFGEDEISEFLKDETEGLTDEDEVPEVPETPVTVEGDVWILGNHRVMCGDSTSADDVAALMDGKTAALLHADPPYGMGKEKDGVANDNLYAEKLDAFQMDWWRAFRSALDDNASAYIWGNAPELWRLWYAGGLKDSERLTFRNEIVWDKKAAGAGGISHMGAEGFRQYPNATERVLFFMLGEQGFNNNADNYWDGWDPVLNSLKTDCDAMGWGAEDIKRICGVGMYGHWFTKSQWTFIPREHYQKLQAAAIESSKDSDAFKRDHDALKRDFYATRAFFDNASDIMRDVWEFPRVTGEERHGHATPKPVAMMERVMKSSLPKGGLCVEPFGGSGSTLMGAEKTGRVCYTMELQPVYVDVIIKRWQNFTGKKATHAETGKTFDESF